MSDDSPASPDSSSDPTPAAKPSPPSPARAKKTAAKSAAKTARKGAAELLTTATPPEITTTAPGDSTKSGGANVPGTPARPSDANPSLSPDSPPAREATEAPPPAVGDDWPEPEAPQATAGPTEGTKRKRRRRKGKGPSQTGPPDTAGRTENGPRNEISIPLEVDAQQPQFAQKEQAPGEEPARQASRQREREEQRSASPAGPRRRVDPETLGKRAWKIFLAEVSEEGVALIGDHDAKELSRRCFRLAEIFLDEQARRLSGQ